MKLNDYVKQCCKNSEFKKYWEEDELFDGRSISEALTVLNEVDSNEVIKNNGIKKDKVHSNEIIFLELPDKSCPVADFLNSIQNQKLKEKTVRSIDLLSQEGSEARPPLSKYVKDGIFELRTQQSTNITRIFYFFIYGEKIILTNGYIKKQDEMDKSEFNRAKKYMNDYLSRTIVWARPKQ